MEKDRYYKAGLNDSWVCFSTQQSVCYLARVISEFFNQKQRTPVYHTSGSVDLQVSLLLL